MTAPLADRLRDALTSLSPARPDSVESLRALYDVGIVFHDPIQETHGLEAFLDVNRRLLRRLKRLDWKVTSARGDENEVFLEWTMRATPNLAPTLVVDGATRAKARGGLVVHHRDYWDFGEMMASAIPGGRRLLQLTRLPFA